MSITPPPQQPPAAAGGPGPAESEIAKLQVDVAVLKEKIKSLRNRSIGAWVGVGYLLIMHLIFGY